jgi:hypothetical protein
MLAATREILLDKLLTLPEMIDAYQRNEIGFASRSAAWLQELEQSLMQLRSPLASTVANQRARIVSALDGYSEALAGHERISRRKAVNITASLALDEAEKVLTSRIAEIDQKFDGWREKLAQFVSVASGSVPIPLPPTEPRSVWLKQTWLSWQTVNETRAMYTYLNTAMTRSDRLYLLAELLDNQLNGN